MSHGHCCWQNPIVEEDYTLCKTGKKNQAGMDLHAPLLLARICITRRLSEDCQRIIANNFSWL